jgi:hypothetical protein
LKFDPFLILKKGLLLLWLVLSSRRQRSGSGRFGRLHMLGWRKISKDKNETCGSGRTGKPVQVGYWHPSH